MFIKKTSHLPFLFLIPIAFDFLRTFCSRNSAYIYLHNPKYRKLSPIYDFLYKILLILLFFSFFSSDYSSPLERAREGWKEGRGGGEEGERGKEEGVWFSQCLFFFVGQFGNKHSRQWALLEPIDQVSSPDIGLLSACLFNNQVGGNPFEF